MRKSNAKSNEKFLAQIKFAIMKRVSRMPRTRLAVTVVHLPKMTNERMSFFNVQLKHIKFTRPCTLV